LNAAHDSLSRAGEPEPGEVDTGSSEPSAADADVRAAVRRLPERQRDALFLRFYLELDYAAIANALGIEVGTVSATLHAARKTLTHALQEVMR
jgi:RNA polymerase sigma factor (sigma-70 family)